jgi:hypothetical protein
MNDPKLKTAIDRTSKALLDFAKVFETRGSHLTDDETTAALTWLSNATSAAIQKAQLNRQIAAPGATTTPIVFQAPPALVLAPTVSVPSPAPTPVSEPRKPREGRLLRVDPNEPAAPVESHRTPVGEPRDNFEDCDFLGDDD